MYKYILGVDASTVNIGYGILDYHSERLVQHGCISFNSAKQPFYFRLAHGAAMMFNEIKVDGIDVCVIEHSFFHKNAYTGKCISMMVATVLYEAMNRGIQHVQELSPTEIKKAFALHGFADKAAMRNSAMFEFGIALSEDETDAAAAAFCFTKLDKNGDFERRANLKREKAYDKAQLKRKKEAEKKGKGLPGEFNF